WSTSKTPSYTKSVSWQHHPGINIPIKDIILLGSVDIRRFIKKLIESSYRDLEVLSYGELTENVPVNILKTI
ncbi:hypothetical protein HC634_22350, partial [Escherichia coli]|nr:hypothetical protein [Escherichia coli]